MLWVDSPGEGSRLKLELYDQSPHSPNQSAQVETLWFLATCRLKKFKTPIDLHERASVNSTVKSVEEDAEEVTGLNTHNRVC